MRVRNIVCAAVAGWLAIGCGGRELREENHPLVRRALTYKRAGDVEAAIGLLHRALERDPRLARAHLELGLLYDQERKDYLLALYHYERYLALRPNADKRAIVEDLARRARLSFAAEMTPTPPGAVEMIAALRRENELLRAAMEERAAAAPAPDRTTASPSPAVPPESRPVALARAEGGASASTPGGLPAPAPVPPPRGVVTYVVQPGDTLSSIAARFYGDPTAARRIHEANRAVIPDPNRLKVGTTLTLPRP